MKIIEQSVECIGVMWPTSWNTWGMVGDDGICYDVSGYLAHREPPGKILEIAGRTCYKSEDKITDSSHKDFISMVCKRNHESVLEHSSASFKIITDRGISHELVRHRIASFSQESTRYVNYTKDKHGKGDIQFILPEDLTDVQKAFFLRAYEIEQNLYNEAIALGCTPQQARDVLPNGVKTELVMTCNFREWKHIMALRDANPAHPKMRVLARMLHIELCKIEPTVFQLEA
jgi:thymidylate synthase (FAD)